MVSKVAKKKEMTTMCSILASLETPLTEHKAKRKQILKNKIKQALFL